MDIAHFPQINPPQRLLMGPGPINADPRVLRAMSSQLIGQYDPAMTDYMTETQALYRQVWATDNDATLLVDGTSRAGIEAILVSLLEPGDRVLVPVAGLDRIIDAGAQSLLGQATGLLLIGSGAALVYAYFVRFLAISIGSIEAGFTQIPRALDHAARSLGHGASSSFRRVHLPLTRPALAAAALLVFVDTMKELSATLLLRPLNFETLATHLYGEAARGTYEDAAIAALIIVAIGILPVIVLARTIRR